MRGLFRPRLVGCSLKHRKGAASEPLGLQKLCLVCFKSWRLVHRVLDDHAAVLCQKAKRKYLFRRALRASVLIRGVEKRKVKPFSRPRKIN